MAEGFSNSHDSGYKHLLEQDFARSKMHSEANFWMETAKGLLPATSDSLNEGLHTGEIWGALGQGAALGVGLSWMTNKFRPAPVRIIGGLINAGMGIKFAWDSGQTVGQLIQLKDKAAGTGNYQNSVYGAQKLAGKFVADGSVGILGAHIGFVGEHGISHAINNWTGKPRLAATVPVGTGELGHFQPTQARSVESSNYFAMSKNDGLSGSDHTIGKGGQAKHSENTQYQDPHEPIEIRDTDGRLRGAYSGNATKAPESNTGHLLSELNRKKGIIQEPDSFAEAGSGEQAKMNRLLSFLLQKEAVKKDVVDRVVGLPLAIEHLQKSPEMIHPTVGELYIKATKKSPEGKPLDVDRLEAIAPIINNLRANEIIAAAEKSPVLGKVFADACLGKHPVDSLVVFTDKNGRLVYKADDKGKSILLHSVMEIFNGDANWKLLSKDDVIHGYAIFERGGNQLLLKCEGAELANLQNCKTWSEFRTATRLRGNKAQFDSRLIKPGLGDDSKCVGGLCPIEDLSWLQARKDGVLSQKPESIPQPKPTAEVVELLNEPGVKLDAIISVPEAMPISQAKDVTASEPTPLSRKEVELQDLIAVNEKLKVKDSQTGEAKPDTPIAKLVREEKGLRDQLAEHAQSELDGVKQGSLNKKQRKEINRRLRQIEIEKDALGVVHEQQASPEVTARTPDVDNLLKPSESTAVPAPESTVSQASESPVVLDQPKWQEYFEIEREARIQGLPEAVIREKLAEWREKHLAEEARVKEATQATVEPQPEQPKVEPQQSETQTQPESASEQPFKKPERAARKTDTEIEVDLRIENKFIADAFKASGRGREGDEVVFFVKGDRGLISLASYPQRNGKPGALSKKDDFYYGRIPVELLKNEVVGWAKVAPKVEEGDYVYRTNPKNPKQKFMEKEVIEAHGLVPRDLRTVAVDNIPKPFNDFGMSKKVFSPAEQTTSASSAESALTVLHKRRDSILKEVDIHLQSLRDGVEEGRLSSSRLDEYKTRLDKIDELIAKEEGQVVGSERTAAKEDTSKVDEPIALEPSVGRSIKLDEMEKLPEKALRTLDSWRNEQDRYQGQYEGTQLSPSEKLYAMRHVAYNLHSRSRELLAQGKVAESEAWAKSLNELVKADKDKQAFDNVDRVKAYSLLGEVSRLRNNINQAYTCLTDAETILKSDPDLENGLLLHSAVLESQTKLHMASNMMAEARKCEARRASIIDELRQVGQDPTTDAGVWKKKTPLMQDGGKFSAERNAKWLGDSLKKLAYFRIRI